MYNYNFCTFTYTKFLFTVYSNSPPTREKIRTDDNVRLRSSEQHRSNSSLSQTSSSGWDQTDSTGK